MKFETVLCRQHGCFSNAQPAKFDVTIIDVPWRTRPQMKRTSWSFFCEDANLKFLVDMDVVLDQNGKPIWEWDVGSKLQDMHISGKHLHLVSIAGLTRPSGPHIQALGSATMRPYYENMNDWYGSMHVMIYIVIIGCNQFANCTTCWSTAPHVKGRHILVWLRHVAAKIPLKSNFFDLCVLWSTSTHGDVHNANMA